MTQVSACLMAYREKELLERALASMSFADEVVAVVDPTGDPETERIARKAGAKVVLHEYAGDIEQKRFAVAQATHDWVLYLDADEEVSPDLRDAIIHEFSHDGGDWAASHAIAVVL